MYIVLRKITACTKLTIADCFYVDEMCCVICVLVFIIYISYNLLFYIMLCWYYILYIYLYS